MEKKKKIDLRKKEEIEIRLRTILHNQRQKTQEWSNKLTRMSSRISSISPPNKKTLSVASSFSERQENPDSALDQLRELDGKLSRSKCLHNSILRDTSSRMADHNEKVEKTLRSQIFIKEINENSKFMNFLGKLDDLDNHRIKKNQQIEYKIKQKTVKETERFSKFRVNQDEEEKKTLDKVKEIEKKHILQKNILMCQVDILNQEKEYKFIKQKLRGDDARENLARKQKAYLQKREKILEKHIEMNQKFLQMKEEKEKNNEKKRHEAIQAVQEHIKAKEVQLMIVKSSNPNSVSKIIEKQF